MTRAIPSIRGVVAATAACHLANRLEDDQLHRRSLHLRLKATELLRAELENGPDEPDLARLLCMLLLAQLDVCITRYFWICLSNSRGRYALGSASNSQHTLMLRVHLQDYVTVRTQSEVSSNSA